MIPKIDKHIGICVFTTSYHGCGGSIKTTASDFIVREIISKSVSKKIDSQGRYPVFVLKKQGIDTNHVLAELYNKTRIRLKALGLKDASAVTEQYVCATGRNNTSKIDDYVAAKYSLKKIGYLPKPLSKKDMIGNRFTIKIKDAGGDVSDFTEHNKILNFFGYQRFGSSRPVTHLVGKAMVQRNFEKAIELLLSYTFHDDPNIEIRNKLKDKNDLRQIIDDIPPKMDIERLVAKEWLDSGNAVLALRAIPLHLRRFFVQSYQSYIFNRTLSKAYSNGEELFVPQESDVCFDKKAVLGKYDNMNDQKLAVPLVGNSYYKKTRFDYYISAILQEEEVSNKDFFIRELQEASVEGGFRHASLVCSDFKVDNNTLSFSLLRGSFATILLREIMKPSDPISAGF